jgi:hypothetical protein
MTGEEIIEKYYCDWIFISCHKYLSEDFIEKHSAKVNWYYISVFQKLSESFVRKFYNKIYWQQISYSQKLSEEFIQEYSDKIDFDRLPCWAYEKYSHKCWNKIKL